MDRIVLPGSGKGAQESEWTDVRSIVVVGSNSSGKSRLGAWLDAKPNLNVHRISAQRVLAINEFIAPRPLEQASRHLHYGHDGKGASHVHKIGNKWGGKPISAQVNDFEPALQVLFAQHAKESVSFRDSEKNNEIDSNRNS